MGLEFGVSPLKFLFFGVELTDRASFAGAGARFWSALVTRVVNGCKMLQKGTGVGGLGRKGRPAARSMASAMASRSKLTNTDSASERV